MIFVMANHDEFWVVRFDAQSGRHGESVYLSEFPERLPNGRYSDYGVVSMGPLESKAEDGYTLPKYVKRFTNRKKAEWHANRRRHWQPTVVAGKHFKVELKR